MPFLGGMPHEKSIDQRHRGIAVGPSFSTLEKPAARTMQMAPSYILLWILAPGVLEKLTWPSLRIVQVEDDTTDVDWHLGYPYKKKVSFSECKLKCPKFPSIEYHYREWYLAGTSRLDWNMRCP